jgi:hypothetical protein
MSNIEKGINAFFAGLILIAVLSVLVKPGAQTPAVLTSGGKAIGSSLTAAEGA